jgi:SAM-dependent methyltransferase
VELPAWKFQNLEISMGLYQRVLGTPFVYNYVRPWVVGGIDMSPVYDRLAPGESDVVLDIGCGTGDALRYLHHFARYVGADIDEVAIRFARQAHGHREHVEFACKLLKEEDVLALCPSHVVMAGLLHHLSDEDAVALLRLALRSPRLQRIVTQDIVFLPGAPINNLFARLDRGRYCRRKEEYEALVRVSGLELKDSTIISSHPKGGRVRYQVMTLEPRQESVPKPANGERRLTAGH